VFLAVKHGITEPILEVQVLGSQQVWCSPAANANVASNTSMIV